MEGKNKFNTYVVSFDYPSSYSSVFLRLRSLMYDMNFSSIVADEDGICGRKGTSDRQSRRCIHIVCLIVTILPEGGLIK